MAKKARQNLVAGMQRCGGGWDAHTVPAIVLGHREGLGSDSRRRRQKLGHGGTNSGTRVPESGWPALLEWLASGTQFLKSRPTEKDAPERGWRDTMAVNGGEGEGPEAHLLPPSMRQPSRTGDFLGKHRLSAAITRLSQEIQFLEVPLYVSSFISFCH
ncbi:hypothetical protein ZIOFF_036774 [Zingiber officinale]|uniref:Uncharacterized protein n=1 Tax=Zingiber officinale TaxID=94328 RepID=A0A8J5GCD7_ZINOF|nr:hypothetical protein ZIOFF_036774 [Zingiber officinale]